VGGKGGRKGGGAGNMVDVRGVFKGCGVGGDDGSRCGGGL